MRSRFRLILLLGCLLVGAALKGQRTYTNINSAWQFSQTSMQEAEIFERVDLPHTFNLEDPFDDEPGYYRGKATYRKVLVTDLLQKTRKYYLRFGAVNQHALVYVNDKLAGEHYGGYTAFNVDITSFLNFSADTITVEVDNSHDENVVPLKGDFTFYGGIYRDVELVSVPSSHFALDHFGSLGVYIKPLEITNDYGKLRLSGYIANSSDSCSVEVRIRNKQGVLIDSAETQSFEESSGFWHTILEVEDAIHWSLDSPYLYTVEFNLIQQERLVDQLHVPYGLRYFHFDPSDGFFLNGEHKKLIGVNRHQDRYGLGNALTDSEHAEDMYLIHKSGVNFLRTAHYPQAPLIVEMCDKLGIAVTMEIPLDHEITYGELFAANAKQMMLEMIYQYYNHPSIVVWAYMNEMGLGKQLKRDSAHMVKVADLARELEELTRDADPHRYTMIPNHGHFDIYHKFGLTQIPMIVGWNLYYGWYEPDFDGLGKFMDHAHAQLPDKPMIITEYGAGADPRLTSFEPIRFDFTLDWSLKFHQSNLRQILDRPFIAGSAVWNMFDFGSEARQDAVPHINNKGLYSYDRKPKPVSYLYKAHMSNEPVCKIEDIPRTILLTDYGNKLTPISVITNRDVVEVTSSDITHDFQTSDYVADCQVEIKKGMNDISICDQTVETTGLDHASFWSQRDTLRINFGSNFYLQQEDGSATWIPDKDVPNAFMRVDGGKTYMPRNRGIGTQKPISYTEIDPVYQTMKDDIDRILLPLPPGKYELLMHFARLDDEKFNCQRLTVNGQVIPICNIEPYVAWYRATQVRSTDILEIEFIGENSETYINGLEIIRLR